MSVGKTMFDFGVSYFNPFVTSVSKWSVCDTLKAISMLTIIAPILMGIVAGVGKALAGRVSPVLPPTAAATSLKATQAAQGISVKPPTSSPAQALTVYVDPSKRSQHSSDYQTTFSIVGEKTNFNKTKENVYFASAACTPLAIAFAATAQQANIKETYATENTPREHLDAFLQDRNKVQLGVAKLQEMISKPKSTVTLNAMNLGVEEGIQIYNAMTKQNIQSKRSYLGEFGSDEYFLTNAGTMDTVSSGEPNDWYKTVLKNLGQGEGAVVVLGGYSIGMRRIKDFYEIFDSHNTFGYTGKQGACVIQASSKKLGVQLEKIVKAGSASAGNRAQMGAQGIEIVVF